MRRLSRAQVREIDRRSIAEYHIPGVVLMENAARAVSDVALEMVRGIPHPRVLIVCGGGNNGGDGLAVARHLHNHRCGVRLCVAADPATYRNEALVNWQIVQAMGLPVVVMNDAKQLPQDDADLLIDALFGTGLSQTPRNPWVIQWINDRHVPVLSVDLPSSMDCDTGEPLGSACVRATRTVTFVAEKIGFANLSARQYLGGVTVADIGCPRELIDAVAAGDFPAHSPGPSA